MTQGSQTSESQTTWPHNDYKVMTDNYKISSRVVERIALPTHSPLPPQSGTHWIDMPWIRVCSPFLRFKGFRVWETSKHRREIRSPEKQPGSRETVWCRFPLLRSPLLPSPRQLFGLTTTQYVLNYATSSQLTSLKAVTLSHCRSSMTPYTQ